MYYDAHDPPWLNKLYIYLLCFITGVVFLSFLAVVLYFDRRGVRRRWWGRHRHHRRRSEHGHSPGSPEPAVPNGNTSGRSAKWVVLWVVMAAVGVAGLVDLSIIADYKTRGHRWFLINWRAFHLHR